MISRVSKIARATWAIAYLFFLLAGVVAFFSPSQIIARPLVTSLVYAWALFLTIGAGLCLGGKLRGNWAGEIIGLPLLSAASLIFGGLLFFNASSAAALAIGGLFCGLATAFEARRMELRKLAKDNQGANDES